jgi:hypothetical protein
MLFGSILALSVELTQVAIPGRYPALGDVLFDTLGSWLGGRTGILARSWPSASRRPGRDAFLASLGAVGLLGATGVLLAPSYPRSTYFVGWTPEVGHLATYDGRVVAASVGGLTASHGRSPRSDDIRRYLLDGRPIRVQAEAGHPVSRLAALFDVVDEKQREILLLGPDRNDFVVRFRTLAVAMGLEGPELRLSDAVRDLRPGEPLVVIAWRDRHHTCARVGDFQGCGPGLTIGSGWSFLVPAQSVPTRWTQTLNGAWLAAVTLAVGLIGCRGWWSLPVMATTLLGVFLIPWVTATAALSYAEIVGVVVGLEGGWALRSWAARHRDRIAERTHAGKTAEQLPQYS